jgi:hypothetical protein
MLLMKKFRGNIIVFSTVIKKFYSIAVSVNGALFNTELSSTRSSLQHGALFNTELSYAYFS